MNAPGSKILLLSLPGEAEAFGQELASGLAQAGVSHEFVDVAPNYYDTILDRLEAGAIPVILKSLRRGNA